MFDFALSFYNQYTILFYVFLIGAVIIEGPITILGLSLIAPQLGFGFLFLYVFSFLWDFWGDILHFFVWRFFHMNVTKNKKFDLLEKLDIRLSKHSLFDTLLVIKFTPPLTSIGLLYLWYKHTPVLKFLKNDALLVSMSSFFIAGVWYIFGKTIANTNDFVYIISWLLFWFLVIYISLKFVSSYYINTYIYGKTGK